MMADKPRDVLMDQETPMDKEVPDHQKEDSPADTEEKPERGHWGKQIEFFFSCLGFCVGYGNVWRFPYLCMRNGGGAFLIPYFGFLFLAGLPMYFLECGIGQFASQSPSRLWATICPLFRGLGIGMVVVCGLATVYYQIIITWVLYYLGHSFQYPLPWQNCDNPWNTVYCTKRGPTNSSVYLNSTEFLANGTRGHVGNVTGILGRSMSPPEEFWQYNALEMTSSIDDVGGLRWQLVICNLIGWLFNILCLIKGVKSLGKVVYVTVTAPYLFLLILLIRGCTLPGAATGIIYYIKPNFSKLLELKVWSEACMQIFYTLGPAWGGIITMASFNKFHNNFYRDVILIPICCCLTSFFAGFVIFSVVGHMAHEANLPVDEVIKSGPGLAFIAYPEALANLPFSPVWSVLFFITLFTVGLDSQFATFETVVCGVVDIFPQHLLGKKSYVMVGLASINFLIGLIFCTRAGVYHFQIWDWYSGAFTVMAFAVLECLIVMYIYGGGRFMHDVRMMLGYTPCLGWRVLLSIVVPLLLLTCLVYAFVLFDAPTYGDYEYPLWAVLMGWALACVSLLQIPGFMIYQLATSEGSLIKRFQVSLRPKAAWGPALEKHRTDKYKSNDVIPRDVELKESRDANSSDGAEKLLTVT